VILIRITGLWGSSFSNAVHGKTPNLLKELLKAGLKVLANLIFLMPKRDVEIVLEPRTLRLSDYKDKQHLNHTLEEWYNQKKDPFYSPPYHFLFRNRPLKRILYSPPVSIVNESILEEVLDCIEKIAGKKVGPKEHLAYDLSLDSLQISELFMLLQEKYNLSDLYTTELATAEHIVALIEGSWIPKRLAHDLHKQEKKAWKFFKKKLPCLDEVFGPLDLDAIGGKINAWKEVFEKEVSEKVHLLIGCGVEAYAAAVGAFYAKKLPSFIKPEEVSNFDRVFTTKETIVRWHAPNCIQGSLIYLPEKSLSAKWQWMPIPKESEAMAYMQDKRVWINNYFQKDPLLFVAMTHNALKQRIPVALPFSGIPNLSWSRRIAQIVER
jgi:acyl carrier protein